MAQDTAWKRLSNLFRTTVFRLSIVYAGVFSLVSVGAFSFVYYSTADHIELQTDARLRLETDVLLNQWGNRPLSALIETVRQRGGASNANIFFYRLIDRRAGASTLSVARLLSEVTQPRTYATLTLAEVVPLKERSAHAGNPVRVLLSRLSNDHFLLVGRDLNEQRALMQHTFEVIVTAVVLTLVIALAGGMLMGYGVLRRIDSVSRTAGEIMAGDLSRRMGVSDRNDEFDQLGRRLNDMLGRIEPLMQGMREVTDNVAHDLRGPLTRLRNRLEVTLLEARDAQEYRTVIEQAIDDADSLIGTFNALLSIAQAEAGVRRQGWSTVDLSEMLGELVELYEPVAEEKGLALQWPSSESILVKGNGRLLAQAVSNLLDNAIKYIPAGGNILINLNRGDGQVDLAVADDGPGVPDTDRGRVTGRFVRLDSARHTPGNGLGLSLVQAVARLHGGTLELSDNQPGLRATLHLPAQSPTAEIRPASAPGA